MNQEFEINQLAELIVNNALQANRVRNLTNVGVIGNTKRPRLYSEFGYPKKLSFSHFFEAYQRMSAGGAAIDRLLDKCWSDMPIVIDGEKSDEDKESSEWELSATKLIKRYFKQLKEADRRNLVGHYSALILQVRDGKAWDEPVDDLSLKSLKDKGIVKLIPVWEIQLKVIEWDTDEKSENYGDPLYFQFDEAGTSFGKNQNRSIKIHHSRVIVLNEGSDDSDPSSGVPLLRLGYNNLLDIEKVAGGSAEGFLKNASRQLGVKLTKETDLATLISEAKSRGYDGLADAMNAQISKLNSGTDSALVMQEGDVSVLSVAPADPMPTWTVSANLFASSVRMPFTILFGQQTGRLASDEDKNDWASRCNERRNTFLTDLILKFINRLIKFGVLDSPKNEEVTVTWSDLLAPSEKEKILNAKELSSVAESSVRAFGISAINPNEIRAIMELEPLDENDLEPPEIDKKGDPLVDEKEKDKQKSDFAEK
ncbi:TPA: DUF1073 domain-containing protein [Pasteurella multocida]|uniref:anti-CBASS protein Acb1 family protein n=1 Tax=Pasteurella multocida TaxID=747 RepID=UPI00035479C0|nr:anti-CBASS Acb1 family protein [Pasteurella multocida]ANJ89326.1 hypothetical protein PMCN01_0077 [Pasteurella multocida subsp. multocida HB01]AON58451.1 hypothetical protein AZI96_06825 [Pasteurella multocida]AUK28648.1 hypothetical protein A4205_08220 [Pasteurella multocida]AUK33863.1 hypothetical protein A4201_02860 [Pasteurella multocida]AUK48443.1 hypothetical protein A4210_01220 [Pasteurella multocida]